MSETTVQPAEDEQVNGVYVASRASVPERGAMWRRFRAQGIPITSSWIDEDGQGETQSLSELWQRIASEIAISVGVVLYVEPNDFPLKGALIEVGIALGMNKPIIVCLPGVTLEERSYRPIGSWVRHPLVTRCDDVERALNLLPVQPAASTPTEVCPSCRADQIKQGKGVAGQLCPQCSLRPRNAAASTEAQDEMPRRYCGVHQREEFKYESLEHELHEADVDKWKRELTEAGWVAESATAWRSPNGGLYRGPYGAWIQLQRQKGITNV